MSECEEIRECDRVRVEVYMCELISGGECVVGSECVVGGESESLCRDVE